MNASQRPVRLSELVAALTGKVAIRAGEDSGEVVVHGIAYDSRQVGGGTLFVALPGSQRDGHSYIHTAVQRGAAAVVGQQPAPDLPVPYVQTTDSRQALAELSAAFYGFPARHLTVIGVTGTDGKTTTSTLIYATLRAAGLRAGMITTVDARIGDQSLDTGFHVTTPEAPDVQNYLHQMAYGLPEPLTHVVIESTSHGLAQKRVAACDFDIGVVTNITHEHLDFHGDYQAYREAKATLFKYLAVTPAKRHSPPRLAVLNRDDGSYAYLAELTAGLSSAVPQVSYGVHPQAQVRAEGVRATEKGLSFTVVTEEETFQVISPLLGAYNVSNLLAAIACSLIGLGLPLEAIQQGIRDVQGIPGRMERLDLGQPFIAIVDFAHTPNALRQALLAVRAVTPGRLIAVFGSAGLRDRQKRRMMAEVSTQLADVSIFTAEDPRTESLDQILAEMAVGAQAAGGSQGENYHLVPDRREAIRVAVRMAQPGDLVLVSGKGHEQSMCFGEVEYPWDDRIATRAALAELLGAPGPQMPYLPESW